MIFAVGLTSITQWDCDSSVVKVSDHGKNVMSSSPVPLTPTPLAMHIKSVESSNVLLLATLAALSNVNGLVAPRMDCTQAAGKWTKLGCITDPTIKPQSSEWKHLSSPTPKKAKTVKLAEHSLQKEVVMVMDSWLRHVMSSNPVPLKACHVGEQCTLNPLRAQTSSRWP
ncbi:hypothetical protein TNCV_2352911 [Trichonephila clavipes]|nr:hypothetical protein TNCV_2352911 [Trichonephila clavipes]